VIGMTIEELKLLRTLRNRVLLALRSE